MALKPKYGSPAVETEFQEQKNLIAALDLFRICYQASANGENRNPITGSRLKAMGVKKGHPDLTIYDPPPNYPGKVGMMIELKRTKGGSVSPEQKEWIFKLQNRGWIAVVCKGYLAALDELYKAGYIPSGKNCNLARGDF